MRRKAVLSVAFTLALGVPVFAAAASRNSAEGAAQRIEGARVRIEAAAPEEAASETLAAEGRAKSTREVLLGRAQMELALARQQYERADFEGARKHADRAARLAWKASDPRKGEK